jgi:ATP-dependent DNA helicase PIF1
MDNNEILKIRQMGIEAFRQTMYPKQLEAFDKAMLAERPLIIASEGGGGKSYIINGLRAFASESTVITSTTGASAVDIGGKTYQSALSVPLGIPTKENMVKKYSSYKEVFKRNHGIKRIVTDEFSMISPHNWDGYLQRLEGISKTSRYKKVVPILFGDPTQCGNIVESHNQTKKLVEAKYGHSKLLASNIFNVDDFDVVILDQNKRAENDPDLQTNLTRVRFGYELEEACNYFNQRVFEKKDIPKDVMNVMVYNKGVEQLNAIAYAKNPNHEWRYEAQVKGRFSEKSTNMKKLLQLKDGLRVMCIKNDPEPEKEYVNGDSGEIVACLPEGVVVMLDRTKQEVLVPYVEDSETEYFTDKNGDLKERVVGTFQQIPLVGMAAITGHKCQGKTLPRVCIDFESYYVFAEGLPYVMLSRVRKLEDLYLVRKLHPKDVKVCPYAKEFYEKFGGIK